jgi:predicted dehydrogenase
MTQTPMTQSRIGVAMLGAGFIAEYHLAGLAAAGGADVRVVVGRTGDKAEAIAKRFGVRDVSVDIEAALGREDVQAVIVATPDDTHEAIAIAAMHAGKAVLLQKPMAGSVAAAQRIIAAAAQNRVDLQVSFMHRFFDEVVLARRWLHEGLLGRVLSARIRNATPGPDWSAWFFRKASVANGVVDQLGVHGIDLVEHLLGHVRTVSGRARIAVPERRLRDGTLVQVETVDNASAIYELDDGPLVTHEMSMTEIAGCDRFRMEIYGEKGTLWLRTERGRLAAVVPGRFGTGWHVPDLLHTPLGLRQHEVWLAGIAGKGPRLTTASDALRGMRIVEALMRSNQRNGQAVAVADAERVTPGDATRVWGSATR